MKAQRRNRGIELLFHLGGTRWGGWLVPRPGRFTPGKELVEVNEMVGSCSTEMRIVFWWGNLNGREHMETISIEGRIILKLC
jgi:hypothetical protein